MSADHYAAIVLAIVAAIVLAWGIAKALREDSVQPPTSPRAPMSERERRYHESNQFGR